MIGDMTIDNTLGASPAGTPGYGASKDMGEMSKEIYDALSLAIHEDYLSEAAIELISVPGLQANAALINAIRAMPLNARESVIRKVATEMAMLRAMEKINLARQLLLTGARDPFVLNSPAHHTIHEYFLPQLDAEYQLIKDQYETQQQVATSTMALLVNQHQEQKIRRPDSSGVSNRSGLLENGALPLSELQE